MLTALTPYEHLLKSLYITLAEVERVRAKACVCERVFASRFNGVNELNISQ